jgi:hypothetical protein
LAEIFDRVLERVRTDSTIPDFKVRVATLAGIVADERTLGFELPPLLKRLYLEIGNGGWGPGYGFLGLTGGSTDDGGETAIQGYFLRQGEDLDDPAWRWAPGLLPICHWGCAIYSCINCLQPGFPVIVFDPNVHEDNRDWTDAFFPECDEFDEWLQLWAEGRDLWQRLYADDGVIARAVESRRGPDARTVAHINPGSARFCTPGSPASSAGS